MIRRVLAPLGGRLATVVTLALVLGAWSGGSWLLRPDEGGGLVLLPGPVQVVQALVDLVVHERFLGDVLLSLMRISLGLLAAIVPAFLLGLTFGIQPRLNAAAAPLFAFAKYVPPVAFIPILILWLGVGLGQQVALLFIGTFFYLTVMIATTVGGTPKTFRDAALTLGVRRSQYVGQVILRYGLPEFVEHLRTMVGIAWTYLIVVEMVAAESGIGRVIISSQRYLESAKVLAGVLTIGLLGILSDQVLQAAGWAMAPWRYDQPPLLVRPLARLAAVRRAPA